MICYIKTKKRLDLLETRLLTQSQQNPFIANMKFETNLGMPYHKTAKY